MNPKQLEASAKHFYDYSNRGQCEQFADRFLASVEQVFKQQHRDYALQFFAHLAPTFLRRYEDLERMKEIQKRVNQGDNTSFKVVLDNEIELLESLLM